MAEEVGQAYVSIVPSLAGFSAKLKSQLATELRGIDSPISEAGSRAGLGFGQRMRDGIASHLAGIGQMLKTGLVIGATAAVAGLGAITTFGLKSAATLEQTQIGMESLLGSADKAKAFIGELQQFAAVTPFQFAGLSDSARRILAFGQAVGITADDVIPTLTTMGDLVSVLGGGQENIDAVVRAMGQIASSGRLLGGDVLQIAQALPGFDVMGAIAKHLGVSTAQALQLREQGKITSQMAIDGILEGMQNFQGAQGAMEKQSQTLLGLWSTFKDTIAIGLTNAFQPVIPQIKTALADITPVIGSAVGQLAPALGGLLAGILPILGGVLSAIMPIITPILDAISNALGSGGLGPTLVFLGNAIGGVIQALAPLLPVILKVVMALADSLAPVIYALTPVIAALVPPLAEVLLALLPILPPLTQLIVALAPLITLTAQLVAWLTDLSVKFAIGPIVKTLTDQMASLTQGIKDLTGWLTGIDWGNLWGQILDGLKQIGHDIGDYFTKLPGRILDNLGNLGSTLYNAGADLIRGLWNGISSLGGWLWQKVKDFVSDNVWKPAKDFLGISSPSTLFADIGEDTVAGYVQGVQNSARLASAAQTAALAPAVGVASGAAPGRQTVDVGSSNPFMLAAIHEIRETIRQHFGGDVDFAIGTT